MKRLILGDSDIENIILLRKQGRTLLAIGAAYRLSSERVRQILERELLRGNWDGKLPDKEIDVFPAETDDRIKDMVAAGETVARMSALLSIPRANLRNRMFVLDLRENDIHQKRPDKSEFKELYLSGKSHSYIAKYFGISFGTVSKYVDEFVLPRRLKPSFSKINGTAMLDALTKIASLDADSEQGKIAKEILSTLNGSPAQVPPGVLAPASAEEDQ